MDGISDESLALLKDCLGELSNGPVSLDDFPLRAIRYLVNTRRVQGACDKIMECVEAMTELKDLELKADPSKLKDMFLEGRFEVRGRDVDNRPVVWLQAPQNSLTMQKPFAEFLIYFFWVFSWGLRCRTSEDAGLFMVFDDSIRPLLDFNLHCVMTIVDLMCRFQLWTNPDARVRFIIKSKIAKTAADQVWRSMGWSQVDRMQIIYEKKEVLQQLADPTNYPEWFLPGGRMYEPTFDAIGEWSCLSSDSAGFKNLSLREVWRPDPAVIDNRRLASESRSCQDTPRSRMPPHELSQSQKCTTGASSGANMMKMASLSVEKPDPISFEDSHDLLTDEIDSNVPEKLCKSCRVDSHRPAIRGSVSVMPATFLSWNVRHPIDCARSRKLDPIREENE